MRGVFLSFLLAVLFGCATTPAFVPEGEVQPKARLSDMDIVAIGTELRARCDQQYGAAPKGKQAQRLAKLTRPLAYEERYTLHFALYSDKIAYANATPDGQIRISSALLEGMTDSEVLFIIGNTLGHLINGDYMQILAITSSADIGLEMEHAGTLLREKELAASLTNTQIDLLQDRLVGARFSLEEELAADAYAVGFMKTHGYDAKAGISALKKLDRVVLRSCDGTNQLHTKERLKQITALLAAKASRGSTHQ